MSDKVKEPEVLTRDGIPDDATIESCYGYVSWADWLKCEAANVNRRAGRDARVERVGNWLALVEHGVMPKLIVDEWNTDRKSRRR
jgi:hypothetical protein